MTSVWIITETCCGELVSVWATEKAARAETDRKNADYMASYNRPNHFEYDEYEVENG